MFPPPGSYRYNTPKPSTVTGTSNHELQCKVMVHCCTRSVLCKPRFWQLMLMVVLVVTTAHFSTVVMFPSVKESLFLIKNEASMKTNHYRRTSYSRIQNVPIQKTDLFLSMESQNKSRNWKSQNMNLISKLQNNSLILNPSTIKVKVPIVGSREKIISNQTVKLCPPIPPHLKGPKKVKLDNIPSLEAQESMFVDLHPGGRFKPKECQARNKVAVIIPFRDRAAHLAVFLYNIHPFLQRQQLDYAIFIVEQAGSNGFNRAMLMNIGSIVALKLYPYNCFIFHDVDLIPEDDRNLYTCPEQPRHMSVAINTFMYRLPYNDIFGGVSAMTVAQFQTVNGFSNKFWGWGGEDDDMSNRIKFHGFFISRFPANVARYTMIPHRKGRPNPQRYKFLNQGRRRFQKDGVNSVTYKILKLELRPLYTWVKVELFKV